MAEELKVLELDGDALEVEADIIWLSHAPNGVCVRGLREAVKGKRFSEISLYEGMALRDAFVGDSPSGSTFACTIPGCTHIEVAQFRDGKMDFASSDARAIEQPAL